MPLKKEELNKSNTCSPVLSEELVYSMLFIQDLLNLLDGCKKLKHARTVYVFEIFYVPSTS